MYQPFPIYDLRSGLQLDREPWMLPTNAFSIAENVFFYQGRILKRRGYEPFAAGTGGSGVNVLATPPVMGIYEYYKTDGSAYLLALDTDYLYEYNSTDDDWIGKGGYPSTPDFTGSDSQFFWAEIWKDLIFFTNNKDNIKYWNGTALTALNPTVNGGDTLDACLLLVAHKNRLIALNTEESGTRFPTRARCSNVGSYTTWTDDIYVDADTVDWIVGVAFVRGELMVFFERSVWWLRYTGDASAPFGWVQIAETEGSYAPFSTVNFEDEAITLGPTSWVGCDGIQVYNIDERVPDLVLTMNPAKLEYAYGFLAEELRQYLCSFPSQGQSYPDKILCMNYVDNCFSVYNLPIHVAGYWTQGAALTYDAISTTYDNTTFCYDEKTLQAGYPITLFGDRSGYVRKMFSTNADNGAAIASQARTKRLVPYQGKKAKLGYIDLIGDSSSVCNFTLKIYKDYSGIPVFSRAINMYEAGKEKTRQRIRIMERGENFLVDISDNAANQPWALDAIIPWFKEAGNL